MCGIAGIVGRSPDRSAALARMLRALAHRGPDGEGTECEALAALGHRRLSIIDVAGGRQPLLDASGSRWLVCNGEIYNYRELRARLAAGGYCFRTHSDCEVILALYERHGVRLLEHLRGMFAFALWDGQQRRLLCARDHLGQKPLYYSFTDGRFAFASEIKALLALDPALRRPDLRALDQYLGLRLIAPPLSMFEGIRKLPPGHLLTVEPGGTPAVAPYWSLEFEPKHSASEPRLLEELEELLSQTLELHLVSDVPVGAFLSGGMDSGLIVAMIARRLGVRGLPTFTLDLPYARYSEGPHAQRVARACGTAHHPATLRPALVRTLPDLVWHLDEPSDPLSLCTYELARFARRHVKVVLGGDGGDELFGGYDRYYGNLYAARYARLPRALRERLLAPLLQLVPEAGWYKSTGHQLRWLQRLSFLSGGARYAASLSYFHLDAAARAALLTEEAKAQLGDWRGERLLEERYERAAGDPLDRMLAVDSAIRLPDHPVMITDRTSMAWGLEARSPFMDHRLAEFAARIPSHLKVRGRSLRCLQRTLARRYLPREIIERPKQGFSSALPYLLEEQYRLLYRGLLADAALVRAGILRREPLRVMLGEHLAGRRDHGSRLWLLINAEVWYRMMIDGESREGMRERLLALAASGAGPATRAVAVPAPEDA